MLIGGRADSGELGSLRKFPGEAFCVTACGVRSHVLRLISWIQRAVADCKSIAKPGQHHQSSFCKALGSSWNDKLMRSNCEDAIDEPFIEAHLIAKRRGWSSIQTDALLDMPWSSPFVTHFRFWFTPLLEKLQQRRNQGSRQARNTVEAACSRGNISKLDLHGRASLSRRVLLVQL